MRIIIETDEHNKARSNTSTTDSAPEANSSYIVDIGPSSNGHDQGENGADPTRSSNGSGHQPLAQDDAINAGGVPDELMQLMSDTEGDDADESQNIGSAPDAV